ncbi:MAG: hypothetical protein SV186_01825 [Candidatus Nanohaloarchaea archaeon]|nr:hypothetical protein [Candidatus Nanohaloarchaea archaeon]
MVTEEMFDGREAYRCDVCGFHYETENDAAACEEYCDTHGSCSSEITRRSLERSDDE